MTDVIYSNTFDAGTDGATWTAAASGGGNGTALVTAQGTGATFTYNAALAAVNGPLGLAITAGSSATYIRGDDPRSDSAPATRSGMRRAFRYNGTPSAAVFLGQIRTLTDANVASFTIQSTGAIRIIAGASANAYTSSTGLLTSGVKYFFELLYTPGATTTTATLEFRVSDSTDATTILTQTLTNVDVGTTDPGQRFRFSGFSGTITNWGTDYIDSIRWGHKATGWLGPIANQLPVVSVPAYQNLSTPGATTVTAIASDSDGTVATYLWSREATKSTASPTLTNTGNATVNVASFPAGNLVTLKLVVTDNDGGPTTVYHEIRTPTSGDVSIIDVALDAPGDSGWTIYGGAGSQAAALNDGSATTGVESPDVPTSPLVHYWRTGPMLPRDALRLYIDKALLTASGTQHTKFRVTQGPDNTLIAEVASSALKDQFTAAVSDLSLSSQDLYFDLTAPQVAAITDWGDLRVGEVVDD